MEQIVLKDSQIEFLIGNNSYAEVADFLFNSQINRWELMKKNYDALNNIQTKSFWFEGFKLKVQFNPERIKSTSAKVDEDSVKNRKCFLCIENLPSEQKGIILFDKYILLCNPYPIFPQHFTVSSLRHKSQRISDSLGEFLEVTKALSPKYVLVYNGPACGASAPDHLHFQAGKKDFIPIENDIQQLKNDFGSIVNDDENYTLSFIDDGLRRLVFIESADKQRIEETFKMIFRIYKKQSGTQPEPMMNIISSHDAECGWSVIIFLRNKHRPDCYFKEDPEKILISPAAIDLGGVVVTPREEDFVKTDKNFLQQIFNEVSLDIKNFSLLEEKLKVELS
jgi:ATP adenylyltransferase/5',5'''-P-1,P-4-tetraphosphate phosphorylase II